MKLNAVQEHLEGKLYRSCCRKVRNQENFNKMKDMGASPALVNDIFSSEAIIKAAQGCNVFMYSRHLFSLLSHDINSNAMNPPPLELFKSVTDEERITKRKLRTEGVKSLFEASKAVGAKTFLHQSLIWVARPKDQSSFDESSPPQDIYEDIVTGEQIVLQGAKENSSQGGVLRLGLLYSADNTLTHKLALNLFKQKIPILGSGDNVFPLLHADDAANAFVVAAERMTSAEDTSLSGVYHVVENSSTTMGDVLQSLAAGIGASPPSSFSPWMASFILGNAAVDFLTSTTLTSNKKFKETFGWNPKYPSFRDGLHQVIAEWKKIGFPHERNE